jgi:hypothetical protein
MAGQHLPMHTRQSAQNSTTHGNRSSGKATGGHQDAPDDGGYNNIDTCKKTTHAWNQRLTKFDMDLWRNNKSGERIKFQVEFEQNMETR